MPKRYAFGFVADPLDSFDREAETSLFLMREIQKRGHFIFVCEPKDLFLKQKELWAFAKQIELTGHKQRFYRILKEGSKALKSLDCLFLRKDPPSDLSYLHHLYLLAKLEKTILMINAPSAILAFNEKLSPLDFPFAPKTVVASRKDLLASFAKPLRLGVILKPLHGGGGVGIHWLKKSEVGSRKSEKTIREMTANGIEPIIGQEYLPAAKIGDKRILLWNGRILGAFLRKPKVGEFRANLHQGGHFVKTTLTPRDLQIAGRVGRWARAKGLYFVGLDVIGSHLTEINVTSPMGIREVNVLYNQQIELKILDDVVRWL